MSAAAPLAVCRWLRARGAYGAAPAAASWESGDSALEAYWCLRTQEATGPDDALVHAHACGAGRACFDAGG